MSCFSEERSHRCVRGVGKATGQGGGSGEEKKRNEVLERHGGRDSFAGTGKKSRSWSLLVTFVMVQHSTKISPSLPSSSSLPPYLASSTHKSELFSSSKASKTWSATAWRRRICSEKGRCCTRGAKSSKKSIGCGENAWTWAKCSSAENIPDISRLIRRCALLFLAPLPPLLPYLKTHPETPADTLSCTAETRLRTVSNLLALPFC